MKITRKIVCLILSFALIFSTFAIVRISAAITETESSDKHLKNGNFEENIENYKFSSYYTQPVKTNVPYWDTTAYGSSGTNGQFEFFKDRCAHFNVTKNDNNLKKDPNYENYQKVAEGEVAAELNADEESTIYQRINTISGSTYTWGLDHRGRDLTDRMVLIIGPQQSVNPSKPSKAGKDQFVRITDWLKKQYSVKYPETGCSKKYTVYSREFDEKGKFKNQSSDEDENISLVKTEVINQEWSIWVISSPYCNTDSDPTKAVNGWSKYGTNVINSDDTKNDKQKFDDIMKGENSSLEYDCTYTVPKGQTKTIFAFCSYSSGKINEPNATYGNLLDDINFDIYQPITTSITPGGKAGADTEHTDGNITITSDITTGKSMSSVVNDGQFCMIYTKQHNDKLTDCNFVGAYVTVSQDDGTPVTKFYGILNNVSSADEAEQSKNGFIETNIADPDDPENPWKYYFRVPVNSPVSIHLIYTKSAYVVYDANGGEDYKFTNDNSQGINIVGFGDYYKKTYDKDGNLLSDLTNIETPDYYTNSQYTVNDVTTPDGSLEGKVNGHYESHAALSNESWDNGSAVFCGWSVKDENGNIVILDGEHTVTFDPYEKNGGYVTITDNSSHSVEGLQLDATHGITLTAVWKFVNRAQAQTLNNKGLYEDNALGGTVEETLITTAGDVTYSPDSGGLEKWKVEAKAAAGEKVMFKATPNDGYKFVGWYGSDENLITSSTSIAVNVEEGQLKTYYARFEKTTVPVIFHYNEKGTGNLADYVYYDADADNKYGKYFQNVVIGGNAVKPSSDSKSVTTWYTSPTERGSEFIFNFSSQITEETHLYAGPTFAFNYYNFFKLKESWYVNTFGTLKFEKSYIDLKNNADVTDYNVYLLKGTLGESTPTPSAIKNNSKTIKVGKSVDNSNLMFNTVTNTNQTFNRAGTTYSDFYLFNMKTPVWVMFDFTYKGVKYTSTIKDRCLYNCITTYMAERENGFYTDYPADAPALCETQEALLDSIKGMYNAYNSVPDFNISDPSKYADASSVEGLTYDASIENPYTFTSTTAIRNIEPWGLKYSFKVDGHKFTEFFDYGAVILKDNEGIFTSDPISISDILGNKNSVMYSKSSGNLYQCTDEAFSGADGAIDIYYVNNMSALNFNKNTYAVFFVKDNDGKCYFSDIISNSYEQLAKDDQSEYKDVSASIINYSEKFREYNKLVEEAKKNSE